MNTRKEVLERLLRTEISPSDIHDALMKLGWDSDKEVVILNRQHILKALSAYVRSELSKEELELWANLIEGREDIGFEEGSEEEIKNILFEIANPLLTEPMTENRAQQLVNTLGNHKPRKA